MIIYPNFALHHHRPTYFFKRKSGMRKLEGTSVIICFDFSLVGKIRRKLKKNGFGFLNRVQIFFVGFFALKKNGIK